MNKKIILTLPLLALSACSASGIALTKDNAMDYIELNGGDHTDCSFAYDSAKKAYDVSFSMYEKKYGFNSDIKGECKFTFNAKDEDLSLPAYPSVNNVTASFVYKEGATAEGDIKQADSLVAGFTIASDVSTYGHCTITNLVITSISGSVQG